MVERMLLIDLYPTAKACVQAFRIADASFDGIQQISPEKVRAFFVAYYLKDHEAKYSVDRPDHHCFY
jgi:hypothetical protein